MGVTRRVLFLTSAAWALSLTTGCTGGKGGDANAASGGDSDASKSAGGKKLKVGLVLDTGGVDDRSFNAAANAGLQKAIKELGVEGKYVESQNESDYKTNMTSFATQNYDLIFAIGFKMHDTLAEVAPQFTKTDFAIIDEHAPTNQPNCAGLLFREQEGSFLAGFVAASVSKSHKIGFVGGMQVPLIEKFEAGYKAGAKTADPNVVVTATYTGDWDDQGKARSQAEQQFGSGADVIYQAAGKAGLGVIEAAKTRGAGFYAIGVDMDQDGIAPGRVLTSMVKHLDNAVFDTIKQLKEGHFEKGDHVFGIKEDGVGLSPMQYTHADVPPAVLAKVETIKQQIVSGKLAPPTNLQELQTFQPPKL